MMRLSGLKPLGLATAALPAEFGASKLLARPERLPVIGHAILQVGFD
jgi:hypothetical protein